MKSITLIAIGLCVAGIAVPAGFAKGQISVKLGDATPRVGQPFTVYVRTGYVVPANDWLRLIAVAPGKGWYEVVGTITGDSSYAHAKIPHDGFGIKLVRTGRYTWRAVVRLPRAGRWRLVVPNGTHQGFHGSAAVSMDAMGARARVTTVTDARARAPAGSPPSRPRRRSTAA